MREKAEKRGERGSMLATTPPIFLSTNVTELIMEQSRILLIKNQYDTGPT